MEVQNDSAEEKNQNNTEMDAENCNLFKSFS